MNRPFEVSPIEALIARGPFRLGNATVDPVSREAYWSVSSERIQPQTFKVLLALASQRGQVVTRNELVELCWDGRIIGDDVINRSISLLRQFAQRAGGFDIETVHKAGYRLLDRQDEVHAGRRTTIAIAGVIAALRVLRS